MMEKVPYHSATNYGKVQEEARSLDRWVSEDGKRVAFSHDFATTLALPADFDRCDFIYAEPPWPAGWKVFYDRIDTPPVTPYPVFLNACSRAIAESGKPGAMIVALDSRVQMMTVPPAYSHLSSVLKLTQQCVMLWYNVAPPKDFAINTEAIEWMATEYDCIGDFTAGYGYTGRLASQGGKDWVLSDLDPKCIGYIAEHAEEWA